MRVVVDTSPYIILCKIDRLRLLQQLYDVIYSTGGVKQELLFPEKAVNFLNDNCTIIDVDDVERCRLSSELNLDGAEVEVFMAYLQLHADEMLFANKRAKQRIGKSGNVRDVIELKDLAEESGVYTRRDSKEFLEALKALGYRQKAVEKELDAYR
jgi:predicted nucleic acid-binding protein